MPRDKKKPKNNPKQSPIDFFFQLSHSTLCSMKEDNEMSSTEIET